MSRQSKNDDPETSLRFIALLTGAAAALAGVLSLFVEVSFTALFIAAESIVFCQGLSLFALGRLRSPDRCEPWPFFIRRFLAVVIGSVAGIPAGLFLSGGSRLLPLSPAGSLACSTGIAIFFGGIFVGGKTVYRRITASSTSAEQYARHKPGELRSSTAIIFTVLFNTLVAGILSGIGFKDSSFYDLFIVSQCIGFSCHFSVYAAFYLLPTFHPLLPSAVGLLAGASVGPLLGSLLVGKTELLLNRNLNAYGQAIVIGLLFGTIASLYFYIKSQLAEARARAETEKAKKLSAEKDAAETSLKLLQARIEPHFLFNTLSNVIGLLETDTAKAKEMLVDLTRYLRTSLVRTRKEQTTLGEEIDLIAAYLNIHQLRIGSRLTFSIDLPAELHEIPLPPMLLQPLVENAIRHGIEPQLEGGSVAVTARAGKDILVLEVADTGQGMGGDGTRPAAGMGVGLQNIRERLESIFANSSRFRIEENIPHGVKVIIEIPLLSGQRSTRQPAANK